MAASALEKDVAEILIDEATLQAKVAELGARISADYVDRQVTLVSVLKGALPLNQALAWSRIERFGPILLIALVASHLFLKVSLLSMLIGPPVRFLSSIFTFGLVG